MWSWLLLFSGASDGRVPHYTRKVYQWHSWTSPDRADQKLSEGVGDPIYWVHVGPTVVSLKHA